MSVIYRQDVICMDNTTGEKYTHVHYSPSLSTACPSQNPNHTFLTVYNVDSTSENSLIIKNDIKTTNGGYHADGFNWSVPPGGESSDFVEIGSFSFPHDICIECSSMDVNTENFNDFVSASMVPPGPISQLSADVSSGNVLTLTTVAYVRIGMTITLIQGPVMQNVGEVIGINLNNLTVTLSGQINQSFTAGTIVTAIAHFITNKKITQFGKLTFGDTIEGNVLLVSNSIMVIKYKNRSSSAKEFAITLEYFA